MILISYIGLLTSSCVTYDAKCHMIYFARITTQIDVTDLVHVFHIVS